MAPLARTQHGRPMGIVLHRIPLLAAITNEFWGPAMDQQTRQQYYLSKANQAEQEVTNVRSPDSRDGWLKLARGYREMASKLGNAGKL